MVTGQYVDPAAGRMTFRQFATQRQESAVQRANTLRLVESSMRLHA